MGERTVTVDEIKDRRVSDLLREIARGGDSIIVVLEEGQMVTLRPTAPLKPLPTLEGRVPGGWKNAIYGA